MKIAVLNFSGNVGKTTVARQMLAPRVGVDRVIPVETINSDGTEEDALKGKQFGQLSDALQLLENAVIDVGASNAEIFLQQMKMYRGSHEDFDFFVIPTVPKNKQERDTISTIEALHEVGVPAKKIRVVFNMVEPDDEPQQLFANLVRYGQEVKKFTLREAVIHTNPIFGFLKAGDLTVKDMVNDTTDLKAAAEAATTQEDKLKISRQIGMRRLAYGVDEELDAAFKALFK
jgi:MinD-like ATPase involved in chromosome partitioning or flagellar assembly